MENRQHLALLGLFIFAWQYLFYGHTLGLNALVFSFVLLGLLIYQFGLPKRLVSQIAVGGYLLSAMGLVLHNSWWNYVLAVITMPFAIGALRHDSLRILWLQPVTILWDSLLINNDLSKYLNRTNTQDNKGTEASFATTFWGVFFAFLVLIFFLNLYLSGSQSFSTDFDYFTKLFFSLFEFSAILFLLLGIILGIILLNRSRNPYLTDYSNTYYTYKQALGQFFLNKNQMRYVFGSSVLVMLNVLLFFVNLSDIKNLLFGKAIDDYQLSNNVHEGTNNLILTMILSGLLYLLLIGRQELQAANSQFLKKLATIWIAQNLVLIMTTAGRNLQYIAVWDLSLKRIGVFIFLAVILASFIILLLRTQRQYTLWKTFGLIACSCYCILNLSALIPMETWVTSYNLQRLQPKSEILFLVKDFDTNNLDVLIHYKDKVANHPNAEAFNRELDLKIQRFQKNDAWQSWTLRSWRIENRL